MRSIALSFFVFFSYVSAALLLPRATPTPACVGLSVKSNNGNRKVALVIDSSGSMLDNDPYDLRLAAGRALNNWLITQAEAKGGTKPDLVTVIDFNSSPQLDYPLGDPAGANSSFDEIGASGGTYIAGGVDLAVTQLRASGSGDTASRSSIIVFTDGQVCRNQGGPNPIPSCTSISINGAATCLCHQDPDLRLRVSIWQPL